MEVREEDEAFSEPAVLGFDGLLDLHNHVRTCPQLIGINDDLCPGQRIVLITDARSDAGASLNQNLVPRFPELMNSGRGDGDAELVVLDFFGD